MVGFTISSRGELPGKKPWIRKGMGKRKRIATVDG
jgi:hypothetical protein